MGIKELGKKLSAKVAVVSIAAIGMVSVAHAELPASVAATLTTMETDGKAMFDLVFPVIGTLVGLVVVIKLFKRFANKV